MRSGGVPERRGAPENADFQSIKNYDCFAGLCAVIRHRLGQQSLERIKQAAELFNWTIEFGLFCCDTKARTELRVGSVVEVGPVLLDRILNRLPDEDQQRNPASEFPPTRLEQRFLPLAPLLTMLKESVEAPIGARISLAFGFLPGSPTCTKWSSMIRVAE